MTTQSPQEVELSFDRGTLILGPAGLSEALVPDGFVTDSRIGGRYRAAASEYRRALAHLMRAGLKVDDRARGYSPLELRARIEREPYPHQQENSLS